ncbi:hypothetical protein [Pseudomonas phage PIP]|nr:hypothetical protein [Pseudomonas phage PIP]
MNRIGTLCVSKRHTAPSVRGTDNQSEVRPPRLPIRWLPTIAMLLRRGPAGPDDILMLWENNPDPWRG